MEIPVEQIKENLIYVDKIIEKPVVYDIVIEKKVEIIKEKIVEVEVEKVIEVPINIYVEKPVIKEKIIEEDLYLETEVIDCFEGDSESEDEERND